MNHPDPSYVPIPANPRKQRRKRSRSLGPDVKAPDGSEACKKFYYKAACRRGDTCKYTHVQGPPQAPKPASAAGTAPVRTRQPRQGRPAKEGAKPAAARVRLPNTKLVDEQGNEVCRQFYYLGTCSRAAGCTFVHVQGPPNALEAAAPVAGNGRRRKPRSTSRVARKPRSTSRVPRLPNAKIFDGQNNELCRQFYFLGKCSQTQPCKFLHANGPPDALKNAAAPKPRNAAEPKQKFVNEQGDEICRNFYLRGNCRDGATCKYVHVAGPPAAGGDAPKRAPRVPQDQIVNENGEEACRNYYHLGRCRFDKCKWVHIAKKE